MSPSALSSTVLPPVFGPETSSVRSLGAISRSNGTTAPPLREQQRMPAVANVEAVVRGDEVGRRASELLGEARARVQRVELDERFERRDHLVAQRPNSTR